MSEPVSIILSEFIDQPVARVWRALTTPELIGKWWAPGDVRAEVGHRFTLDMGKWGLQPCEVIAVQPEQLIRYTFSSAMTITWRLKAEGAGTQLTLEHEGFDLTTPLGRTAYEGMGSGWPSVLKRIGPVLAEEVA